jgi:hypothetical protein
MERRHSQTGISIGDCAYLVRQRRGRGIVASGWFTSEIYPHEHWDGSGKTTTYANLELDVILPPRGQTGH